MAFRLMDFCTSPVLVENTETYKMHMAMVSRGKNPVCNEHLEVGECRMIRLWKVVLPNETIKFVLAENAERAIGQATCGLKNDLLVEKDCVAYQIPFRIQGWGNNEY